MAVEKNRRFRGRGEEGQALVIFAAGVVVLLGFLAMSIDVGRLVWARTQMQAAVDASALAGAQSMPNQGEAESMAASYWLDNSGFIQSQGNNIQFTTTFPSDSNKGIHVQAEADIPTWFARFFGVPKWHVSAEGEAESQVLDIAIVLDTSGSMCFDTYQDVEGTAWMGPGKSPATIVEDMPAGGNSTTVHVSDARAFDDYQDDRYGGRRGTIRIDDELMTITNVSTRNGTITVTRGVRNDVTGASTAKTAHRAGTVIYRNWNSCKDAAPSNGGPYEPYDTMIDDAQFFVGMFDERYDKIGVGSFSTKAQLGRALTPSFSSVESTLESLAIPDGSTNIAHGISMGRQILDGGGKRANATRIIVFLTDGVANTYCGSSWYNSNSYDNPSCSDHSGTAAARDHAVREAQRAAGESITIYTIGLGNDLDENLLQQIASESGGEYYHAPTTAELDDAFEAIAESTHIKLSR
ncbi:MAG: VWA domain-containing protein [Hyphomicrobiales bacterium]